MDQTYFATFFEDNQFGMWQIFINYSIRQSPSHTLTLFRMGFFGAAHRWEGGKKPPLPTLKSVTYILNDETWHIYTLLPKEDPKNM